MSARHFLLCSALLLSYFSGVLGHGYLTVPKSRNYLANLAGQEYCQQCLSAGGPATVQSYTPGGQYPMPTETLTSSVRHTMCGESDALAPADRHYNPYPAPAVSSLPVYAPGQDIDIEVIITAHHRGHFEFRLCDAAKLSDPTTVNWACLSQNVLQRVSVPGEMSTVDVNHPERYYLEPTCAPGYNTTIKMRYHIPSNLTCERCIMQWWWVSANTCNPPDYATRSPMPSYVAPCIWWEPTLPVCGTAYPEEFWNCADIHISGTATSPPPAVPTAPPVQPKAPVAPPAAPKAPPAAPKAPPAAPKAPPAAPKAPPAAPKAAPAAPKAPPVAPKAAPAAPKAPPAAPTATCSALGTQCGGDGWTGPTCCVSGSQCYAYISTYSQCRSDGCPAGWLCQTQTAAKSFVTAAVEWAKGLVN